MINQLIIEMVRKIVDSAEVWGLLTRTFSVVSEASVDAKLSKRQAVCLKIR